MADVDYSAANTFVSTHYASLRGSSDQYFPSQTTATEPIFDGRLGVYDDNDVLQQASLGSCGFTLRPSPTSVTNWSSLEQISHLYLPELRQTILDAFAYDCDGARGITDMVFWNPMLRGEGWVPDEHTPGTEATACGPIAGMAHLDTDMNFFGGRTDELVRMVERNRVESLIEGQPPSGAPLKGRGRALADAVGSGRRRFAVVNAWRSIDQQEPVRRAPLAVLATKYKTGEEKRAVPEASPCMDRSKWYVFPHMRSDEVLLFTQYDRSVEQPSDVWHCALPGVSEGNEAPPRRSFELRCLVVFEEELPYECDRFSGGAAPRYPNAAIVAQRA